MSNFGGGGILRKESIFPGKEVREYLGKKQNCITT